VSLALLVIWSKKVVAAVTVASFSLFLLESARPSLRPRRPLPAATDGRLFLDGRGRVSPIREVDAETAPSRPSCSDTDRGSEVSILAVEQDSGGLDEPTSPKAKAKTKKRSWKKLIAGAKKLHKGRKGKEADSLGSFRSDGDGDDAEASSVRRGNATATDSRRGTVNQTDAAAVAEEPDSPRGSRRSQGGIEVVAAPVEIDAPAVNLVQEEEESEAGSRFPAALVLVALALAGLVAGKLPAVALTVLCYAFLRSVRGSPRGGGCPPGRRSEVPHVVVTDVNYN